MALTIDTIPSKLNELQSFTLLVETTNTLMNSDYLIVSVPTIYLYVFVSTVNVNSALVNLSTVLSQSLCQSALYFCSHFASNPYQIKV